MAPVTLAIINPTMSSTTLSRTRAESTSTRPITRAAPVVAASTSPQLPPNPSARMV